MSTKNMQPLPGNHGVVPVLYLDLGAGHAAIAEEAERRLMMVRAITATLLGTSVESFGKHDQANLCEVLHTLTNEANGLYGAAYRLACDAKRTRGRVE